MIGTVLTGKGGEVGMNDTDFKQIENNLKQALEYEQKLNNQLMGKLDTYENIVRTIIKLLIAELKGSR